MLNIYRPSSAGGDEFLPEFVIFVYCLGAKIIG